jgi:hypothetical protein
MTRELPDEVLDLLDYQAGVLSRAQAQRAGMTGKQIDTAARSGRWQRLHAGVYAAFTGEPGRGPALGRRVTGWAEGRAQPLLGRRITGAGGHARSGHPRHGAHR